MRDREAGAFVTWCRGEAVEEWCGDDDRRPWGTLCGIVARHHQRGGRGGWYDACGCGPHCHGRALLSRRLRALIRRLDRATLRGLVIDDDRGARVELVAYLCDFGRERDLVETIVSPFAGDERFDDAAQRFRTEHAVRNNHGRDASLLWTAVIALTAVSARFLWIDGPQTCSPWPACFPSRADSISAPHPVRRA